MSKKPHEGILLRDVRTAIKQGEVVDPKKAGITLRGPDTWSDGEKVQLVWIQLAVTGKFEGHASGPFELTIETFDEVCRNFRIRGLPVAFDVEHVSEGDPAQGNIPVTGTPAWGWIHDLVNKGPGGLWGLVEWLDTARDAIKKGEYAYVSPALRLGAKDPKSGKPVGARLSSAALTNNPFLNDLPALVAARDAPPPKMSDHVARVRACLTDHANCSDVACMNLHSAADALCTYCSDDAPAEGDVTMRTSGAVVAMREIVTMRNAEIVTLKANLAERDGELLALREAEDERILDEAFDTYSSKKPMSKESMRALLKADRGMFDAEFPPLKPTLRHLLRDVTPKEPKPTAAPRITSFERDAIATRLLGTGEAANWVEAREQADRIISGAQG